MKCANCEKELDESWKICPFCGTEVPKAPKNIDEFLKDFIDDYGTSIFKEENNNRLERAMSDQPEMYADDRDIIKLLQIKNIPDRLCSVLEQSDDEKNKAVQDSANILTDKFGINGESASKMLSLITDAIGLKATVEIGNGSGTFKDPRDGQVYKTCKIGDQVWLAENLKYETKSGCYVFDNDYQYLDQYGYLYLHDVLSEAIPEGWHLPTEEELKAMERFIVKTNRCKKATPYLLSEEWISMMTDDNSCFCNRNDMEIISKWKSDGIVDYYGFSALPGGEASESVGWGSPSDRTKIKPQYSNMHFSSEWFFKVDKKEYCSWSIICDPSGRENSIIKIGPTYKPISYIRLIKD